MCGIAGILSCETGNGETIVRRMVKTLYHRGPDHSGIWADESAGLTLGHARLAILDLSPTGHQPMVSHCGRYVISFNGEIYNHKALRRELEKIGHTFHGRSDTEVMLACISQYGLEAAVKYFVGMFAFALWDRQERTLYLVRDRLGEKPIYYGWMDKTFLFGSELKALRVHPNFKNEINRDALALYLRHNYIPAPYTIYRGIYKVLPGTIVGLSSEEIEKKGSLRFSSPLTSRIYWSAKNVAEAGIADQFSKPETEAVQHLENLLRDAVRQQMVADVPLGAFLSGGVDSSTVVALMQAQSERPVKTFTIGFNEQGYNEAEHAKAVARHLGTEHTELYVNPEDAMAVIPMLPTLYDEPFSDSSQIPTFLVSQLAKQHVTVSLSGDGGDELFGGYNRYYWGQSIWRKMGWIPKGLRNVLAKGLTVLSPQTWKVLFYALDPLLPEKIKQSNPGDKLHKLAEIMAVDHPEAMYYGLASHWKLPTSVVLGATEPPTVLTDHNQWADLSDFTQLMIYLDTVSYLPDDILVKVDRASMGVSLEARVPFLDHRVVEFAWRLPLNMKIRNGQGKHILRQVLYKYVPQKMIERPKSGFGIPIDSWLRGALRDWAEALLNESRLRQEGFFDPQPIRKKWREHLSGKRNWAYHLWDVLMFQGWKERNNP
ncbi:asparagine synthase (glutamine-hydrolyzing) [Patescibacteria group bacterium]|nr:asparagine synthase (glutamine-hydrolyzing) [Desulfobacteraceae bacterium]MBU4027190.1 asparagine synthase (glutamine-hydrolyzing) [Patescibacteria group bacterium]MBU4069306.1 asparagine synthase (glutamine-hydrolyzing) [Pseudomonadota bacterium]